LLNNAKKPDADSFSFSQVGQVGPDVSGFM